MFWVKKKQTKSLWVNGHSREYIFPKSMIVSRILFFYYNKSAEISFQELKF